MSEATLVIEGVVITLELADDTQVNCMNALRQVMEAFELEEDERIVVAEWFRMRYGYTTREVER